MLKRVGQSRHPCRIPTVVRNQSPILLLKRTALVALSWRFLMTGIRLALMLYLSLIHISEPTRLHRISYAVFFNGSIGDSVSYTHLTLPTTAEV